MFAKHLGAVNTSLRYAVIGGNPERSGRAVRCARQVGSRSGRGWDHL